MIDDHILERLMLTELQKQKLPRLFSMYDGDNNGFIQQDDFERILQQYSQFRNWTPDSPEYKSLQSKLMSRWNSMQKFADTNDDNKISLDEWLAYVDNLINDKQAYEAEVNGIVSFLFSLFDVDGNDQLDLSEYRQFYRTVGLDENAANEVFKQLNLKDNDYISKEKHLELIDQFFRSEDPEATGNFVFGRGR
jgi:juvenile hormone diol kinase